MIRFYHVNRWRAAPVIAATSSHPHFPATATQNRFPTESWRSRYGPGSGWGQFTLTAAVNDRLDFTDSFGAALTAILTPALYNNGDVLAAHIKAQMDAVSGDTWTVEILESGANVHHWQITSNNAGGAGNVTLRWNTGANKARSIAGTIGFDDAADDAGALFYVGDYGAIHTAENITADLGASYPIYGIFIKNCNVQVGSTIKIEASTNNFATTALSITLTPGADVIALVWDTARTYRYWRIWIEDPTNPDGFVELGVVYVGEQFAPLRNFHYDRDQGFADPSLIKESEGGQESTIQHERYKTFPYYFNGTNEIAEFDTMIEDRGYSRDLFYVEDHVYYLSTAKFVKFIEYDPKHLQGDYWNINLRMQELR